MGRLLRRHAHGVLLLAFFVASRAVLLARSPAFDVSTLEYFWQYADPKLLREDLLRTVFYLHSQPPLFNLYLGLVLKLAPHNLSQVFLVGNLITSLCFSLSLYGLMRQVNVPRTLALVLTAAFIVNPSYLSYEYWLFYDFHAAALLCMTAFGFAWFVRSGRPAAAAATAAVAAVLVLTISNFPYAWLMFLVGAMVVLHWRKWKKIVTAVALPVLLVTAVHAKNYVLFRHFSLSTFFVAGNLAFISAEKIPLETRQRLVDEGRLSRMAMAGAFSDYAAYAPLMKGTEVTGVPILDQRTKDSGAINFHNIFFLRKSDDLVRDFRFVLANFPSYMMSVWDKIQLWSLEPSNHCWGIPHYAWLEPATAPFVFLLPFVLLIPLGYGLVLVARRPWARYHKSFNAGFGFVLANILGLNIPLILLTWEVNRYRFRTDALSLVVLAVTLAHLGRAIARRWRVRGIPQSHVIPVPATGAIGKRPVAALGEQLDRLTAHVSHYGDFLVSLPRDLDVWIAKNGEAIFGVQPWRRREERSVEGLPLRFALGRRGLYVFLPAQVGGNTATIEDFQLPPGSEVTLLGNPGHLCYSQDGTRAVIHLPDDAGGGVLRLTPAS